MLAWNVVLSDEPTRLMSLASTHDEGKNAHVHFEMKPAASSSDSAYFTVRSQCCRTREGECVVCTVTRCTSTGGAICHAYAQQRTPTLVRSNKHILLPIVSSKEEEDTKKRSLRVMMWTLSEYYYYYYYYYYYARLQSHLVAAVPTRFESDPARMRVLNGDDGAENVAAKIAKKCGLPVFVTMDLEPIVRSGGPAGDDDDGDKGGARAEAVRAEVARTFIAMIDGEGQRR